MALSQLAKLKEFLTDLTCSLFQRLLSVAYILSWDQTIFAQYEISRHLFFMQFRTQCISTRLYICFKTIFNAIFNFVVTKMSIPISIQIMVCYIA